MLLRKRRQFDASFFSFAWAVNSAQTAVSVGYAMVRGLLCRIGAMISPQSAPMFRSKGERKLSRSARFRAKTLPRERAVSASRREANVTPPARGWRTSGRSNVKSPSALRARFMRADRLRLRGLVREEEK
jgi:hypothetical protein